MFVVAGAIPRSGRAGLQETRNLKQETRSLLPSAVEFHLSL
jgi:hypothetical protein